MRIRVASYNIHGGIGRGGVRDFDRIVQVLQELDCDVLALQEVVATGTRGNLLDELSSATGCIGLAGPTLMRHGGPYGNALLTRLPVRELQRIDLSVAGREPRGALIAELGCGQAPIQVAATHLGLAPGERRLQISRLLRLASHRSRMLAILMGDINEWFLWGRPLRWLHAAYGNAPAVRTFPAAFPLFALDRIWAHPMHALQRLWVHDSALARTASDHLPVVGELVCPVAEPVSE